MSPVGWTEVWCDTPLGTSAHMPPERVVTGRAPLPHHSQQLPSDARQLSFDELAVLRASDEVNADSVIAEILASVTSP
jgi:hypothetical protein